MSTEVTIKIGNPMFTEPQKFAPGGAVTVSSGVSRTSGSPWVMIMASDPMRPCDALTVADALRSAARSALGLGNAAPTDDQQLMFNSTLEDGRVALWKRIALDPPRPT